MIWAGKNRFPVENDDRKQVRMVNRITNKQLLSGWGRFNEVESMCLGVSAASAVQEAVDSLGDGQSVCLRGLGRSYGDSAVLSKGLVLSNNRQGRFRKFDPGTGQVDVQSGLSLKDLGEVALRKGWFLPTTPGTQYVTVGGAIAADVHGKNHHVDGSWGDWVLSIDLILADGSSITCSREQNSELFWATIGGMGLTGYIASAVIQLRKCATAYYNVNYRKARNLESTLELIAETGSDYTYSVGWIDCLGGGEKGGRSVLMLANDARVEDLPDKSRAQPLQVKAKSGPNVPFDFPGFALNRYSVKAFNWLYFNANREGSRIVDYLSYFYPLDAIGNWNRIYGKRGFVQYQALFPFETARVGLKKVLHILEQFGLASFLAVIKSCGPSNSGLLSYLHEGVTLALDIPNKGPKLLEMARQLDEVLLDHGGRLYLAKDALMSARTFSRMYPNKEAFLEVKSRYDPHNRFSSDQARRLNLVV